MNTSTTHMALVSRPCVPPPVKRAKKARQLAERGMATAEYAVGILAAVALALVLMKIFNSDSFMGIIGNLIGSIFEHILSWL